MAVKSITHSKCTALTVRQVNKQTIPLVVRLFVIQYDLLRLQIDCTVIK